MPVGVQKTTTVHSLSSLPFQKVSSNPIHSCRSCWLRGGCDRVCARLEGVCSLDKKSHYLRVFMEPFIAPAESESGGLFLTRRPRPSAMGWSPRPQWRACLKAPMSRLPEREVVSAGSQLPFLTFVCRPSDLRKTLVLGNAQKQRLHVKNETQFEQLSYKPFRNDRPARISLEIYLDFLLRLTDIKKMASNGIHLFVLLNAPNRNLIT